MAVVCHLAIASNDKFVLMATVMSLDSDSGHLGWEEARRDGPLGKAGEPPGTMLGSPCDLLCIPSAVPRSWQSPHFIDEVRKGQETCPRSHGRCVGQCDSTNGFYSIKLHLADGGRFGSPVGIVWQPLAGSLRQGWGWEEQG